MRSGIFAFVAFFVSAGVPRALDATASTSHGVFRIHFIGKVFEVGDRVLVAPEDVTIKNAAPSPVGAKKVRVSVMLKEMVEAHVYNSISLSTADFRAWKGRNVVMDGVEYSTTLKKGHDLSFRIIGVMDYGNPIAYKMPYNTDTNFRSAGEPFTDENLTYPIEQVQDPLLGPIEVPRRERFKTVGELAQNVIQSVVRVDVMGDYREDGKYGWKVQTGTGFVIDPSGYILTNHHVAHPVKKGFEWIRRDIRLEFRFRSGERQVESLLVPAREIGSDEPSDIAVLKVEPEDVLPAGAPLLTAKKEFAQWLPFAYGTGLGEEVVAVGFARGTAGFPTVTKGIVGAVSRSSEGGLLGGMIQTDAAINTGNSGGPLLDLYGNVVGINTSTVHYDFSTSDAIEGISYARSYITDSEMSRLIIRQGRMIDRRQLYRKLLRFTANVGDDFASLLATALPVKGVMIRRSLNYVPDGKGPITGDFVTGIDTSRKHYAIDSVGDLDNVLAFVRPEDELTLHYTRLPQACRDAFTGENRDSIEYKIIAEWRRDKDFVTDLPTVIRRPPE